MRKDGLIMGKVINYEHWRSASIRLLLYYMKLRTLRTAWHPHGDQTDTLLSTCHLMIKWLCAQGWSHHGEGHQLWTLKKCINSVAALLHETDDPQNSLAPTRWPDWHPVIYMSLNDKVTLCARMVSSQGRSSTMNIEEVYRLGCCFQGSHTLVKMKFPTFSRPQDHTFFKCLKAVFFQIYSDII